MKTIQELKKGGRDKTLRAGEAARLLDCSAGSIHRWTTECGLFTPISTPGGQARLYRVQERTILVDAIVILSCNDPSQGV